MTLHSLADMDAAGCRRVAFPPNQQELRDFPSWHFAMLNDRARNEAIERAIKALDVAGKTVVEIGAGSGLIALLFARHGARRIVTCEMNRQLADVARQIVRQSGFGERITILPMSSSEAIARGLIDFTPDFIFTETLDCGVIGEGFFSIAEDIAALAGQDTTILPRRIDQEGLIVSSQDFRNLNEVGTVCGFDLSALNRFSTHSYFPVRSHLYDFTPLTGSAVVRCYDYAAYSPPPAVRLAADASGRADGLLTWLNIDFGGFSFTNDVGTTSHWHQAFHPFANPMLLAQGDVVEICIDDWGQAALSPVASSAA